MAVFVFDIRAEEYREFIIRKKRIISSVEKVLEQLSSRAKTTQQAGYVFIQCTYDLHQFLFVSFLLFVQ
jgi:hypothetical protein